MWDWETAFQLGGTAKGLCHVFNNPNEDTFTVAHRASAHLQYVFAGQNPVPGIGIWIPNNGDGAVMFDGELNATPIDIHSGQSFRLIYLVERNGAFYIPNSDSVPLRPGVWQLHVTIAGTNFKSYSGLIPYRIYADGRINVNEEPWMEESTTNE